MIILESNRAILASVGLGIVFLFSSCSDFVIPSIDQAAKQSDFVVIGRVDTNSVFGFYRFDRLVASRDGKPFLMASNEVLPGVSFPIERASSYGEQAMVFFSGDPTRGTLRENLVVFFYQGQSGDRESLDDVISKVNRVVKGSR